ncbi:MAG: zinc ribbon domain-containing protein [Polyangia bacterium]
MPIYEYQCDSCGPFAASRLMSSSALPAPCPECGAAAARVLSATAISRGRSGKTRPARAFRDPALVKSSREPPPPRPVAGGAGGRPWMLGH